MKIRINGTDATKRFITSITKDFQKDKPNMSHIDYTACLQNKHRNSTLLTDENRGVLRNVSLLYVNTSRFFRGIRAAIGNNTGNMIIHQKPFFMSKETAVKHVVKFLEKLQPETAAKPQKVSSKLYHCGPIADKSPNRK